MMKMIHCPKPKRELIILNKTDLINKNDNQLEEKDKTDGKDKTFSTASERLMEL